MKTKILLAISVLLVFGLAIVAYSYSTAPSSDTAAMACCCCSGDSCPMKSKAESGKETASCCDNCSCCNGEGASCPLKAGADGKMVKMEGASCCPMMKDGKHAEMKDGASCPMMKKGDVSAPVAVDVKNDAKSMHADMKAKHGEGCCCACCNKESKDKTKIDAPQG